MNLQVCVLIQVDECFLDDFGEQICEERGYFEQISFGLWAGLCNCFVVVVTSLIINKCFPSQKDNFDIGNACLVDYCLACGSCMVYMYDDVSVLIRLTGVRMHYIDRKGFNRIYTGFWSDNDSRSSGPLSFRAMTEALQGFKDPILTKIGGPSMVGYSL